MLKISSLKVSIDKKEILKGVDLEVGSGQLHVLMGPNGSGKSTLAQVVMGSPGYTIDNGQLTFDKKNIKKLTPDKRARLGIFLAFQQPVEVPGVSVFNVLRRVKQVTSNTKQVTRKKKNNGEWQVASGGSISEFRNQLLEYAASLKLSDDFLRRSLNEGFSGGEKKRSEILQMMALKPKLVILDEIDSGLDVDALKLVSSAINQFRFNNPRSSVFLITHYARILKYLKPDFVHIMVEGRIVKSGRAKLAKEIEEKGYQAFDKRSMAV